MTPAIRAAEAAQIEFSLHRYEHDPKAESFGLEAAEKLGVSPQRVFKTLVAQVDGKQLIMAIIPVAERLDLKKLAARAGGKKAELADPIAAERATGYVVGGIGPLGGRKKLPTMLDASAQTFNTIFISAGQRGVQMELLREDLVRLTAATIADLTTQ
jgi:Cys-tRNA(Pro)/Cys-tRNA(Cys) deacylase